MRQVHLNRNRFLVFSPENIGRQYSIGLTVCAVLLNGGHGPPYEMIFTDKEATFVLLRLSLDDAVNKTNNPSDRSSRKPSVM